MPSKEYHARTQQFNSRSNAHSQCARDGRISDSHRPLYSTFPRIRQHCQILTSHHHANLTIPINTITSLQRPSYQDIYRAMYCLSCLACLFSMTQKSTHVRQPFCQPRGEEAACTHSKTSNAIRYNITELHIHSSSPKPTTKVKSQS